MASGVGFAVWSSKKEKPATAHKVSYTVAMKENKTKTCANAGALPQLTPTQNKRQPCRIPREKQYTRNTDAPYVRSVETVHHVHMKR